MTGGDREFPLHVWARSVSRRGSFSGSCSGVRATVGEYGIPFLKNDLQSSDISSKDDAKRHTKQADGAGGSRMKQKKSCGDG